MAFIVSISFSSGYGSLSGKTTAPTSSVRVLHSLKDLNLRFVPSQRLRASVRLADNSEENLIMRMRVICAEHARYYNQRSWTYHMPHPLLQETWKHNMF